MQLQRALAVLQTVLGTTLTPTPGAADPSEAGAAGAAAAAGGEDEGGVARKRARLAAAASLLLADSALCVQLQLGVARADCQQSAALSEKARLPRGVPPLSRTVASVSPERCKNARAPRRGCGHGRSRARYAAEPVLRALVRPARRLWPTRGRAGWRRPTAYSAPASTASTCADSWRWRGCSWARARGRREGAVTPSLLPRSQASHTPPTDDAEDDVANYRLNYDVLESQLACTQARRHTDTQTQSWHTET